MSIVDQIKTARTPKPANKLISAIANRFSPRVFNTEPIPETDLAIMFEAARLAPSGRNNQPWQYLWTRQGSKSHERLFGCIPERNFWAKTAPVMVICAFDPAEPIDGINRWAQYDLGQATISLILQAQELGYSCRQIGSFEPEKVRVEFTELKPGYIPLVLLALGKMGTEADYADVDPIIIDKEIQPWARKAVIAGELK